MPNDKQLEEASKDTAKTNEPAPDSNLNRVNPAEVDPSTEATCSDSLMDQLVLVCCENSLRLFSAKSLIQVLYLSLSE